ncbi:hypothetical protein ACH4ND_01415 [Streptomyces sp. NPDC017179]|uniref:hypothetical protein n=1 Tax=Streptomyces sp. NPDC017179 TaxID=3364979 RepID=UPI0037A83E87
MTDHFARPDGAASSRPDRVAELHQLADADYASTAHLRNQNPTWPLRSGTALPVHGTPYDALFTPGEDRTPDVHTVDLALRMARESLDRCAPKNVHSEGQMLTAAVELDFALRQLVTALDAERGESQ